MEGRRVAGGGGGDGGGSVNATHLIAFQETDADSVRVTSNVIVGKSTKRRLNLKLVKQKHITLSSIKS